MRKGLLVMALLSAFCLLVESGIPLPKIPAGIYKPEDRAAYVISHFWDGADWPTVASDESLEQSFVNWFSIFSLAGTGAKADSIRISAVSSVYARAAAASPECIDSFCELAQKYLFDIDSPYIDDELYMVFLEGQIASGSLDKLHTMRAEGQMNILRNMRVGGPSETFSFKDAEGKKHSFSSIPGKRLLILYDSNCQTCKELLAELEGTQLPEDLTVVKVSVDINPALNGGVFAMRHSPEVFLIAADGTVLAKHLYSLERIQEALASAE